MAVAVDRIHDGRVQGGLPGNAPVQCRLYALDPLGAIMERHIISAGRRASRIGGAEGTGAGQVQQDLSRCPR